MIYQLKQVNESNKMLVGGKAYALAKLANHSIKIPKSICLGVSAYKRFVRDTELVGCIQMEFHRKDISQMRWEEMWDASLRIQNMFQTTNWPAELRDEIINAVEPGFGTQPVVIRSSAPGEDTNKTSFAGLHESYVNIRGIKSILEHIKLVWASLWSDAALMYRRELGLEVETSQMAVLIQELITGESSGIVFSQSPVDASQAVIESVYGLNQALVDGSIEPDRWNLDRKSGAILSCQAAVKTKMMIPGKHGLDMVILPSAKIEKPCLEAKQVQQIFQLSQKLESLFQEPQDVEWTIRQDMPYTLQSRPITIKTGDPRNWYMSLRRSFEDLQNLKSDIQDKLIPQMIREGEMMTNMDITQLSNKELQREIERRKEVYKKWQDIYWDKFIPFAHGVRLFGQFYNQAIKPEDPYEFLELLANTPMLSTRRNDMLEQLAQRLRESPALIDNLRHHPERLDENFKQQLQDFLDGYGNQAWGLADTPEFHDNLINLLLEMAAAPPKTKKTVTKTIASLERQYLSFFPKDKQDYASEILKLARVSYQLRDDDNIYLGRIENGVITALQEFLHRTKKQSESQRDFMNYEEMLASLKKIKESSLRGLTTYISDPAFVVKARQLTGQPTSGGLATGRARVISEPQQLFEIKSGEILVCDSIDPNMTFVIPIVTAIVERRGGMLIHGAIIAREYGIPCVTGIPEATSLIKTGFDLTVDGFTGIVTIHTE